MKSQFITYKEAKQLHKLGFSEECFAGYLKKEKTLWIGYVSSEGGEQFNRNYHILAPTFSQAFRWFREKFSIQATIEPTKDQYRFELGFNYWIWNTKTGEEWFTEPKDRPAGDYVFDTYEEAELECLKKLIEIVKEKK